MWVFNTNKEVISSPAIAGGILYIGSTDGSLIGEHTSDDQSYLVQLLLSAGFIFVIILAIIIVWKYHKKRRSFFGKKNRCLVVQNLRYSRM
jgi:membrane protein DedA with SNARE-associated domain